MKFPVIPVSSGLIIQNNKVLIGLRSENDNGGGLWEFPGGKIEIDESSEEAVIRELNEELDIVVHKPKKVMQYLHRFKNLIYDIHFFEVISFKGSVKNKVHEADAIAVSSKDSTGFDKLSKEILNLID